MAPFGRLPDLPLAEATSVANGFPANAADRVLATVQLRVTAWSIIEAFVKHDHPQWSSDDVARATRERFGASTR